MSNIMCDDHNYKDHISTALSSLYGAFSWTRRVFGGEHPVPRLVVSLPTQITEKGPDASTEHSVAQNWTTDVAPAKI